MAKELRNAFITRQVLHLHRLFFLAVALIFAPSACPAANPAKAEKKSPETGNSLRTSATGGSRWTKLDGARIHYVSHGKGSEALVLIHGCCSERRSC